MTSRRDFLKQLAARWSSASAASAAIADAIVSSAQEPVRHASGPCDARAARLVDRDRRRRQRHRVHGQVRARSGHLHRADAAGGRGALACRSSRVTLIQCDTAVDARSGHDVGQPVASDEFQRGEPRAGVRHGARGAAAAGRGRGSGVPVDQLTVVDGVVSVQGGRGAGGSATASSSAARKFNLTLEPDGETEARRASGRCSARRCRASTCRRWRPARFEFVHNVRVPGMLHGRVVRPPAVGATLVSVDESSVSDHAGLRQGRRQEELRRRRRARSRGRRFRRRRS